MLRPVSMQYVTLQFLREDAIRVSVTLAEFGQFSPDAMSYAGESMRDRPAKHYRDIYRSAQGRLDKISNHVSLPVGQPRTREVTELELGGLNERLGIIWRTFSELEEELRSLKEQQKQVRQLLASLDKFAAFKVDLALLQRPGCFLNLHVGTVPPDSLNRLREALGIAGHILHVVHRGGDEIHVVVAGAQDSRPKEVDRLLEAAGFRRMQLPPEFHDTPEHVRGKLLERMTGLTRHIGEVRRRLRERVDEYRAELQSAAEALVLAAPHARLASYLVARGGLALVSGWVPRDEVERLRNSLDVYLPHPFVLHARDPKPRERGQVPSKLSHPAFLRPFVTLVNNYGVPGYGEVDPTVPFALSFVLMFGMMFGDVGHGLVIAVAGWLARGRLHGFGSFAVAAGSASILFGFLYGSVFGYEEWIRPLWMAPLHDPILMLTLALAWGIGFILFTGSLTVINRFTSGRLVAALFDGHGMAGLAMFAGGVYGVWSWLEKGRYGAVEASVLLVPAALVLLNIWFRTRAPLGERLLVTLIEGFDTAISYVSNSLSFLRVAAFSLNHVALAFAVFTLAADLGSAGHWVTLVLGNIFIIVLEGAIVAIQVLRLEYYEGFSRFFGGEGRPFRPLTLGVVG